MRRTRRSVDRETRVYDQLDCNTMTVYPRRHVDTALSVRTSIEIFPSGRRRRIANKPQLMLTDPGEREQIPLLMKQRREEHDCDSNL